MKLERKLLIAIPAHGWSLALEETVTSIRKNVCGLHNDVEIVITNSHNRLPLKGFEDITEIMIPSDYYWTGAVQVIYDKFHELKYSYLLLMNHDCSLDKNCINELINFIERHPRTVCHALLLYKSTSVVWWGGTIHKCFRRLFFINHNRHYLKVGPTPYETDSMMGQCMLMPAEAVRKEYLHLDKLPHYYADSVQTCEMRKNGFKLFIIPKAIAFTDQSDAVSKIKKITPVTFRVLLRSWLHPSSNRNLKSVLYSSYYHQDCVVAKIVMPPYEVFGKITISLFHFFKIKIAKYFSLIAVFFKID